MPGFSSLPDDGKIWEIELLAPGDVARARHAASRAMDAIGASQLQKTRFVTAVSEIARNAIVHGGGGRAVFRVEYCDGEACVEAIFTDDGPGIPDIDLALQNGYTTAKGLGLGLGGAKRLVDAFSVRSVSGEGVTVHLSSRAR